MFVIQYFIQLIDCGLRNLLVPIVQWLQTPRIAPYVSRFDARGDKFGNKTISLSRFLDFFGFPRLGNPGLAYSMKESFRNKEHSHVPIGLSWEYMA